MKPTTKTETEKQIICPADSAMHDCRGCQIAQECKADIRAYQEAHRIAPVIDAEIQNQYLAGRTLV